VVEALRVIAQETEAGQKHWGLLTALHIAAGVMREAEEARAAARAAAIAAWEEFDNTP
jgi:hypothetical protein